MGPACGAAPARGNPRKWLRRLHAWCGMALAALLVLFAVTGFLLNHRAVLKIPAFERQEVRELLPLPAPAASPEALAARAGPALGLRPDALRIRVEPARVLEWNGRRVEQPERWLLLADAPSESIQLEHWAGSRQVEVRRIRPNLWLHLARLHMGIGVGPAWVLLADTVALGLLFLGLSGLWFWSRLHGPRSRLGWLATGGLVLAVGLGWLAG